MQGSDHKDRDVRNNVLAVWAALLVSSLVIWAAGAWIVSSLMPL